MPRPGAGRPRPRPPTIGRRALIRSAAGAALLGLAGCGAGEDIADVPPTSPPPPVTPPPTQPPIASPVPGYVDPERWAGRTVTVASWGGDYQDAQAGAIFDPFAAATGARVQQKANDLGELRQQVEQESVVWDLVVVPSEEVRPLASDDVLTPIDYQRVDKTPLFEEIAMQHGVGAAFFSTVIAFRAVAPVPPAGWPDFWDLTSFPGERALRGGPIGTLEFALLADGVPLAELYPLDVERAFASLDTLKPHVAQWYENRNQPVALLLGGDVAMASAYSVSAATPEAQAGVAVQWRGGMLAADSWVIPRGAPNAEIAMDLINFATRAIPCANFARLVPYGPVNRDAFALLQPDRLPLLPNSEQNRNLQFVQNWNWWADNRDDLTARFDDWLLVDPEPTASGATPDPGPEETAGTSRRLPFASRR